MKKMNRIKLALDIVLLLLLLLMYKKDVLGLSFHEIGGIALSGLFIIHKLINIKWIVATTGKLFSKRISWRLKLNWLIDVLQLLSFAYILVSGIFISKFLFGSAHGASAFKTGHYAVSALALVLVGLHIGLHYEWIIKRTPARRLPLWLRRGAAVVTSLAILAFGVYQMTETSFLDWMRGLGATIGASQADLEADHGEEPPLAFADGEGLPLEMEEQAEGGHGNGPRNGQGKGAGNGNGATADLALHTEYLGQVLLGFLSITLAFSTAVAWIDGALRIRKQKKLLKCDIPA